MGGFRSAALGRIEAILNRALDHDPATRRALAALNGKTLAIRITWPRESLSALFTADGQLRLSATEPEAPTTTLSGSIPALVRIAADTRPRVSFVGTGVQVTGE